MSPLARTRPAPRRSAGAVPAAATPSPLVMLPSRRSSAGLRAPRPWQRSLPPPRPPRGSPSMTSSQRERTFQVRDLSLKSRKKLFLECPIPLISFRGHAVQQERSPECGSSRRGRNPQVSGCCGRGGQEETPGQNRRGHQDRKQHLLLHLTQR